ncbi:MAG: type II secretion system protein N [Betaproteobacteria bacterium]
MARATSAPLSPWTWALSGAVLGLVLATVAYPPARWLAQGLEAASDGRLRMADAQGTLWSGSAQLALTGGPGSQDASTLPGRLAWTLQPGWGRLQASLFADCCMQSPLALDLSPRWGGLNLAVADQQSQWPALWLTGLGTPWNTLRAEGQLAVSTQALQARWVHGRLSLQGELQLDAQGIASRLSTLRPMGSYRFVLKGGDTPVLTLSTKNGSLQLSGRGQWTQGQLRFEGEARAAPERQDALSNLLNIIGRRDGARSIITVG